jgi:rubrerythrin
MKTLRYRPTRNRFDMPLCIYCNNCKNHWILKAGKKYPSKCPHCDAPQKDLGYIAVAPKGR